MAGRTATRDYDLPPGLTLQQAVLLLNERLRDLAQAGASLEVTGDLDMRGFRIVNLADPQAGQDALTRAAGDRRYLQTAARTESAVGGGSTPAAPASAAAGKRQLVLTVPGTLGIGSNLAPLVMLDEARSPRELVALVKQAPVGEDLKIEIGLDGAKWAEPVIRDGQTRGTLSAAGLGAIGADKPLTLSITSTGSTFPGADLTLLIRL
jgi:hypothetical protein